MSLDGIPQMTLTDLSNNRESILYKGLSGTGKTHNAMTWPGKKLVFYFDKNQKTLAKMMSKSPGEVQAYFPESWHQFAEQIVPTIAARKEECETIIIDTVDFAVAMMWRELQGNRPRLTMQDFGTGLNRLRQTFDELTSATRPRKDKPAYNIVCTCHIGDVTNDEGGLIRTTPKIMGAFKDELEDFFDTVLLCAVKVESNKVKEGGREVLKPKARYFCHSVPPSMYHTCKADSLPPQTGGTYPELSESWNLLQLEKKYKEEN